VFEKPDKTARPGENEDEEDAAEVERTSVSGAGVGL
jgi:hypothetical protein